MKMWGYVYGGGGCYVGLRQRPDKVGVKWVRRARGAKKKGRY